MLHTEFISRFTYKKAQAVSLTRVHVAGPVNKIGNERILRKEVWPICFVYQIANKSD